MSNKLEHSQIIYYSEYLKKIRDTKFDTEPFNFPGGSVTKLKQIYIYLPEKLLEINKYNKDIILLDLYNDLKDAVEYRVLTNHSHIVAQPLMETYTSLCDVLDVFLDNNKIKYFDEFLLWCNLSSYVIDFYK